MQVDLNGPKGGDELIVMVKYSDITNKTFKVKSPGWFCIGWSDLA